MKKIACFISAFILVVSVFSQNPIPKDSLQLNAGVGLSSWGIPIYIGMDYGIGKEFSLGGELSFRHYNEDWKGYRYNHNVTGLSGNCNYHFNKIMSIPPKWDLYVGANLGFKIWHSPDKYPGDHASGLELGLHVGGRYYVKNRLGINMEFGGGNAFSEGKIGVSVKL